MCTIIVMQGWHRDFPLVVAANRDEFYDRAALPPAVLTPSPLAVGGRDGLHGGSWLGVTATGLVVALTNQRTYAPPDPTRRSRGRLVLESLRRGSFEAVERYVAGLDAREFNPFNLLFADARHAAVAYGRTDDSRLEVERVTASPCVLVNDRLGSAEFPKAERAAKLVEPLRDAPWPVLVEGLRLALADHERPDEGVLPDPPAGSLLPKSILRELQALCIHTPRYGTRSATIVAVAPGRVAHYLTCEGPPCQGAFVDATALLQSAG